MKQIPLDPHLDWPRPELSQARIDIQAMCESPGWAALMRAVDDRLKFEQRVQMDSMPGQGDAQWERQIGRLDGMRRVEGLALGIVAAGEKADAETRAVEAA